MRRKRRKMWRRAIQRKTMTNRARTRQRKEAKNLPRQNPVEGGEGHLRGREEVRSDSEANPAAALYNLWN